jgi:hypothetical protein
MDKGSSPTPGRPTRVVLLEFYGKTIVLEIEYIVIEISINYVNVVTFNHLMMKILQSKFK